MEKVPVTVRVNGMEVEALVEPRLTLADFLRETIGLTGTKLGCEHGVCGACRLAQRGDRAVLPDVRDPSRRRKPDHGRSL
jgi:aerobic carbon-monoxide dehydrogenase small subunit